MNSFDFTSLDKVEYEKRNKNNGETDDENESILVISMKSEDHLPLQSKNSNIINNKTQTNELKSSTVTLKEEENDDDSYIDMRNTYLPIKLEELFDELNNKNFKTLDQLSNNFSSFIMDIWSLISTECKDLNVDLLKKNKDSLLNKIDSLHDHLKASSGNINNNNDNDDNSKMQLIHLNDQINESKKNLKQITDQINEQNEFLKSNYKIKINLLTTKKKLTNINSILKGFSVELHNRMQDINDANLNKTVLEEAEWIYSQVLIENAKEIEEIRNNPNITIEIETCNNDNKVIIINIKGESLNECLMVKRNLQEMFLNLKKTFVQDEIIVDSIDINEYEQELKEITNVYNVKVTFNDQNILKKVYIEGDYGSVFYAKKLLEKTLINEDAAATKFLRQETKLEFYQSDQDLDLESESDSDDEEPVVSPKQPEQQSTSSIFESVLSSNFGSITSDRNQLGSFIDIPQMDTQKKDKTGDFYISYNDGFESVYKDDLKTLVNDLSSGERKEEINNITTNDNNDKDDYDNTFVYECPVCFIPINKAFITFELFEAHVESCDNTMLTCFRCLASFDLSKQAEYEKHVTDHF
jgi:hypothetical protein